MLQKPRGNAKELQLVLIDRPRHYPYVHCSVCFGIREWQPAATHLCNLYCVRYILRRKISKSN